MSQLVSPQLNRRQPRLQWSQGLTAWFLTVCFGLSIGGCTQSGAPDSNAATEVNQGNASETQPPQEPQPAPPTPQAVASNKAELTQKLETGLQGELSKQLGGIPIQAINCPNLEKIEAGKVFDCEATIAEGKFPVTVTLTNAEGGVQLKTKQLVVLSKVETWLQQGIKEKSGLDYKAKCNGKIVLIQQSAQTVTCTLTDTNGQSKTATVTIQDENNIKAKWEK